MTKETLIEMCNKRADKLDNDVNTGRRTAKEVTDMFGGYLLAMTESCEELIQKKANDMSKRSHDTMFSYGDKKLSQGYIDRHLLTLCDEIRDLRAYIMED